MVMKNEKAEVKFKEGVYGFIFDSSNDSIVHVFREPMTEIKLELVRDVIDDDACIFTDIKEVNAVFDFDVESFCVDMDEVGYGKILEYVE
jgi:hypothetical protein